MQCGHWSKKWWTITSKLLQGAAFRVDFIALKMVVVTIYQHYSCIIDATIARCIINATIARCSM